MISLPFNGIEGGQCPFLWLLFIYFVVVIFWSNYLNELSSTGAFRVHELDGLHSCISENNMTLEESVVKYFILLTYHSTTFLSHFNPTHKRYGTSSDWGSQSPFARKSNARLPESSMWGLHFAWKYRSSFFPSGELQPPDPPPVSCSYSRTLLNLYRFYAIQRV